MVLDIGIKPFTKLFLLLQARNVVFCIPTIKNMK